MWSRLCVCVWGGGWLTCDPWLADHSLTSPSRAADAMCRPEGLCVCGCGCVCVGVCVCVGGGVTDLRPVAGWPQLDLSVQGRRRYVSTGGTVCVCGCGCVCVCVWGGWLTWDPWLADHSLTSPSRAADAMCRPEGLCVCVWGGGGDWPVTRGWLTTAWPLRPGPRTLCVDQRDCTPRHELPSCVHAIPAKIAYSVMHFRFSLVIFSVYHVYDILTHSPY